MPRSEIILRIAAVLLFLYGVVSICTGLMYCLSATAAVTIVYGAILIICGFVWIATGITGVRTANDRSKAETFFKLSIAGLAVSGINLAFTGILGGDIFQPLIITFALAGCLFLAYCFKTQSKES